MEAKKETAHDEAMLHMKKATELLRESVNMHEAETDGQITEDEAIYRVVGLNERAGLESDLASESIRDFLDASEKD